MQGGADVSVERRGGPAEGYGRGDKVRMPFGDFVRRAAAGDERLYLTAQQVLLSSHSFSAGAALPGHRPARCSTAAHRARAAALARSVPAHE